MKPPTRHSLNIENFSTLKNHKHINHMLLEFIYSHTHQFLELFKVICTNFL